MSKCRICDRDNPTGVDRCQGCGAWLEQAVPEASERQAADVGPASAEPAPPPDSLEGRVLTLMQGQKKIEAIKFYRQTTGAGLKAAKDAVEALAEKHGIASKGTGCTAAALVMVLASAVLVAGVWIIAT